MLTLRGAALAAAAFALVSGCTDLDSGIDTCEFVNDCDAIPVQPGPGAGGADPVAVDSVWGCLDDSAPAPEEMLAELPTYDTPPERVLLLTTIVDGDEIGAPIDGLTIRVCTNGDVACTNDLSDPNGANPIASPARLYNGTASTYAILFPYNVEGVDVYLRIEAPNFAPFDYYLADELNIGVGVRAPVPDGVGGTVDAVVFFTRPVPIPSETTFLNYYPDFGGGHTEIDDSGIVIARIFDCMGRPAQNTRLTIQNEASVIEASQDLIGFSLLSSVPTELPGTATTSAQGVAGYANFRAGTLGFTAVNGNGDAFASVGLRSRPGNVTIVDMRPASPYLRAQPPPPAQ